MHINDLPPELHERIVAHLPISDQNTVLVTSKNLCAATVAARENRTRSDARRPDRFTEELFPTTLELVQRGLPLASIQLGSIQLLRACAALQRPALQPMYMAYQYRCCAERKSCVPVPNGVYLGELDGENLPHGYGTFISTNAGAMLSFAGEWCKGKRSGFGIQCRWKPQIGDEPELRDGWYEGFWRNDQPHGRGMQVAHDLRVREGLWEEGRYMGRPNLHRQSTADGR